MTLFDWIFFVGGDQKGDSAEEEGKLSEEEKAARAAEFLDEDRKWSL